MAHTMLLQSIFLLLLFYPLTIDMIKLNSPYKRRHTQTITKQNFTAHAIYNKLYQYHLNINYTNINAIEPRNKVWFSIENRTIYALPFFDDYPGPFYVKFRNKNNLELKLKFDFSPSPSLFSPSNHLLLAVFNMSFINYSRSTLNRYFIIQTLSYALNLDHSLITIHKINGSIIKVYFSCDLYSSKDLSHQLKTLINNYYSKRVQLNKLFRLPLIEISIVRISKQSSLTSTISMRNYVNTPKIKMTSKQNETSSYNRLLILNQLYQPMILVPVLIILFGFILCTIIACCLCCHRNSSTSSMFILPNGLAEKKSDNKHFYKNYYYYEHRQQQSLYKKKRYLSDQRQYISKGIPVIFTEELDDRLEQTNTPLVMRIERAQRN